jgi:hypothetical protein
MEENLHHGSSTFRVSSKLYFIMAQVNDVALRAFNHMYNDDDKSKYRQPTQTKFMVTDIAKSPIGNKL